MFFDKRTIVKKIIRESAKNNLSSKDSLNIAYGVDENFLFGAAISMTSILLNNSDIDITFHLFTDYVDDDYCLRVKELADKYNTCIIIYVIDSESIKRLPSSVSWSYAMYFRFIAFEYLCYELDSLLYLDADIMCKNSLSLLKNMALDEKYAAVIKDIGNTRSSSFERLELDGIQNQYFNSGVIYANLFKWREESLTEKALGMLSDSELVKKLYYYDQDVLNILFFGKVIFLSKDYNCIYTLKNEIKTDDHQKYKSIITDSTVLIHYTGITKPWHEWSRYPAARFFDIAYEASPWKGLPLIKAKTKKQLKKEYKHEFKQGKRIKGLSTYIKYLLSK